MKRILLIYTQCSSSWARARVCVCVSECVCVCVDGSMPRGCNSASFLFYIECISYLYIYIYIFRHNLCIIKFWRGVDGIRRTLLLLPI